MTQCPNTELVRGWNGAWARCRRTAGHAGPCRFTDLEPVTGDELPTPAELAPTHPSLSRPLLYDQGTPALRRRHAVAIGAGIGLVLVAVVLVVLVRGGVL